MTHTIKLVPVAAALVLAACGSEPEVDPQLKADLEAAAAGTIELAPQGTGTAVVSGIEQVQRNQPRATAPRPRTPVTSPTVTPTQTQSPASQRTEPAATVPSSRPAVQPPPPGGYKTVDEVIRKAPFPIKPVTKKP